MSDARDDKYKALFEGQAGTVLGTVKEKLIAAKERWARDNRRLTDDAKEAKARPWQRPNRLPPGQELVKNWPVLDVGLKPLVPLDQWELTVAGRVENRVRWTWADFLAQPQTAITTDIHCVTAWSRFDNRWRGVSARHFLAVVRPKPEARFVVFLSHDGYTTNVPMGYFAADDVLFAHQWNGQPLAREHGGPVRVVIPKLYFWKSAKWVRHVVFLESDKPGFWETRGYHNVGDPWKQERYG
jgi:DMSO/TMAO reductase YedYZ molybdopterin-dependent catalytic subunit